MSNFITGRNFGSKIQTADLADNATTNDTTVLNEITWPEEPS